MRLSEAVHLTHPLGLTTVGGKRNLPGTVSVVAQRRQSTVIIMPATVPQPDSSCPRTLGMHAAVHPPRGKEARARASSILLTAQRHHPPGLASH